MEVERVNILCKEIAVLRGEKEELNSQKKEVQKSIDTKEEDLVLLLTELDLPRWEVTGIGRFSLSKSSYYKIIDDQALREYFIVKHPDLQSMLSVNANKLRAWANNEPGISYDEVGIRPDHRLGIKFHPLN